MIFRVDAAWNATFKTSISAYHQIGGAAMKTGIHPIDIEALEREKKPWDLYYVASVLYELLSRQRGYTIKPILTPKDSKKGG